MIKYNFSLLGLSLFFSFFTACSTAPNRYPVRRGTAPINNAKSGKSAKETKSSVATETIYAPHTPDTHPMLQSNPSGAAINPNEMRPPQPQSPSASSETASDSQQTVASTQTIPGAANPIPQLTATAPDNLGYLKNQAASKKISEELINTKLTESELEAAAAEPTLAQYRPNILFKLGEFSQRAHNSSKALEYYRAVTAQYPTHPFATQAESSIQLIQSTQSADANVIGAILPLTGKNASIGQHALNALRMGLGLNKPDARLRLAIYDTQSQPEMASAGVDKLVRDDKAIALIGGLSSKEAVAIAQRAETIGIPFMGLSQKSGLTQIGDYIFRNSLTAEMQVDQMVQFAFEKLSAKRFAILYPNDTYGVEFSNIFWDHVLARGGQITAAQTYDPKENDFTTTIQKLIGTYYVDARADEYKARIEEIKKAREEKEEKNKKKNKQVKNKNLREHEAEEAILKPIIDFDVLFLPDSGKTLGQVIAFMKANEVSKLTYLGTNIWNTPDLVKRTAAHQENVYFVDAIDPNDNSIRQSTFFKDYVSEYNEEPTLIEMQAFESAKIMKDQITSGGSNRELLANKLRSMGRSSGVTGELRMSNLREIERPIHIMSIDRSLIKTVQ